MPSATSAVTVRGAQKDPKESAADRSTNILPRRPLHLPMCALRAVGSIAAGPCATAMVEVAHSGRATVSAGSNALRKRAKGVRLLVIRQDTLSRGRFSAGFCLGSTSAPTYLSAIERTPTCCLRRRFSSALEPFPDRPAVFVASAYSWDRLSISDPSSPTCRLACCSGRLRRGRLCREPRATMGLARHRGRHAPRPCESAYTSFAHVFPFACRRCTSGRTRSASPSKFSVQSRLLTRKRTAAVRMGRILQQSG